MNLLPALTDNAAAVERKLFWRYKGKWQRAARIGNYKYLKILTRLRLRPTRCIRNLNSCGYRSM